MNKKLIAGMTSTALIASIGAPAFAANFSDVNGHWAASTINKLADAGIINGMDTSHFSPEGTLTRAQFAKLVSVALKLDTTSTTSSFADVSGWAVGFVEAAKKAGIINGTDATHFDPEGVLTREQAAAIMVRALRTVGELQPGTALSFPDAGQVSAWFKSDIEVAVTNGLLNGKDGKLAPQGSATRAEAAVLTDRFVTKSDELKAAVKDLKVASVSAINLKQVKVVFTKEVDKYSAETISNYLEDLVPLSAAKAELQSDKKSVLITYTTKKDQQKKVSITVKNVLDAAAEKKVETASKDVVFSDVTIPAVVSVTPEGNKKVVVEFSEPVSADAIANSSYKLDGLDLSAFGANTPTWVDQTAPAKNNKVTLNFGVAIPAGAHTLTVKDATIKDEASFPVTKADFSFAIADDKTGPASVAGTAKDLNTLELAFDEAVELPAEGDITINGSTLSGSTISYKSGTSDKKTVVITKTNLLSKGANLLVIAKDKVVDLFGNTSATAFRVTVDAATDTVKPQLKSVSATNDTTIKVVFSETVGASATNTANYVIKDAAGNTVGTINSVTPVAGQDYTYNLNLASALPGGTYSVEVSGVSDTSDNAIDKVSKSVSITDTTAPTVSSVTLIDPTEKILKVSFSEPMDRTSIGTLSNYKVKVDTGLFADLPAETVITVADNNKSATIDLPNIAAYTGLDASGGDQVKVGLVKDAAGNYLNNFAADVTVDPASTLTPNFLRATATGKTQLVVEYDRPLNTVEANDFLYNGTAAIGAVLQNTKVRNAADTADIDGSKVTLTFPANTVDTAVANTLTSDTTAANINTKDAYGNKVANAGSYTKAASQLKDKVAPTYANADVVATDTTHITITFSENMKTELSGLYKNDFTVANGGASKTITSSSASGNVVTLTLGSAVNLGQNIVVTPVSGTLNVQDTAGNVLVPSTDNLAGASTGVGTGVTGLAAQTTAGVASTPGTKEVNTLAVTGTGTAGTSDVVFNDGTTTKTVTVTLVAGDSAVVMAGKAQAALAADTTINPVYDVTNPTGTANVVFTAKTAGADKTVTITVTSGTGGMAGTASETTLGVAPTAGTAEVNTLTLTAPARNGNVTVAFNDGTVNQTVTFAVLATDTAAQVAAKAQTALVANATINGAYNVTNAAGSANVLFTAKTAAADKTVTITVQ